MYVFSDGLFCALYSAAVIFLLLSWGICYKQVRIFSRRCLGDCMHLSVHRGESDFHAVSIISPAKELIS